MCENASKRCFLFQTDWETRQGLAKSIEYLFILKLYDLT